MAQRFLQGATVPCCVKHLVYNDSNDSWEEISLDANFPTLTIWDPSGTKVVDGEVMTTVGTARYRYLYQLAIDAPTGFWKRLYEGQYTGEGAEVQKPLLSDGFWVD